MGNWPSQILSAKLPVSIFALDLTSLLFIPLTTVNVVLPQFFLSVPLSHFFLLLFLYILAERFLFSKIV